MIDTDLLKRYKENEIDLDTLIEVIGRSLYDGKKVGGVIYTPSSIVNRIIDTLDVCASQTFLEPSAGHGAFVIPLLEKLSVNWSAQETLSWCQSHLTAVDISLQTTEDLKEILCAWFVRNFKTLFIPSDMTFVKCQDGLFLEKTYDVIFGNPPYIRFQNLEEDYRLLLQDNFASCKKGNVDIYYAFLEKAVTLGSKVGFIVPNSFLTTQSGLSLRKILEDKIDEIIDFGHHKVFDNASTYTCLVFCNSNNRKIVFHTPSQKSSPFKVVQERLPSVRKVQGPIATLCDAAYKVDRIAGRYYARETGLEVEVELVRPLIKVTKFWQEDLKDWSSFVLSPYVNGSLVSEDVLSRVYPKAFEHFQKMKTKLGSRDKGKTSKYPAWFSYGREQGLGLISGPKVLCIPAMMGGRSLPFVMDITSFHSNAPFIVSGYLIDNPSQEDIDKFLSDDFKDFVASNGQAKPGKDDKLFYTIASWMVKGF
jgi:hypothetical protein